MKKERERKQQNVYSNKEKACIQGTNDSSIVSKYSAESVYSTRNCSFLRHFIGNEQARRRSPIINRGYWLRMQCVEYIVRTFLQDASTSRRVIVNLGCGYDPLPFEFLFQGFRDNVLYVDIDYPALISIKAERVASDASLNSLLHNVLIEDSPKDLSQIKLRSDEYLAIGCDLEHLDWLQSIFEKEGLLDGEMLFIAEVSITYMRTSAADALIKWAATLPNASFSLVEQIIPDGPANPFARNMLKHFESLRTPLQSVRTYPTIQAQVQRFSCAGWQAISAVDLLGFWANHIDDHEKERIGQLEGFDEWEEFFLFAQHYCLLYAANNGKVDYLSIEGEGKGGEVYSLSNQQQRDSSTASSVGVFHVRLCEPFRRRFCAGESLNGISIICHGGLGSVGRTDECNTISLAGIIKNTHKASAGSSPKPRMCHTLTKIDDKRFVLFGGRTSPMTILGDTWIFDGNNWKLYEYQIEQWKLFHAGVLQRTLFPRPRFRHCAISNQRTKELLIYGGVTDDNRVLGDFYIFRPDHGWSECTVSISDGPLSPRFAAAMCSISDDTALLTGGMGVDGNTLDDLWKITWSYESGVVAQRVDTQMLEGKRFLKRFGAQMVAAEGSTEVLLIGGVSGGSLMRSSESIVVIDRTSEGGFFVKESFGVEMSEPPLFVGFTAKYVGDGAILIAGGGAVCFSMGSEWNERILLIGKQQTKLNVICAAAASLLQQDLVGEVSKVSAIIKTNSPSSLPLNMMVREPRCKQIPRITLTNPTDLLDLISKNEPAILENIYFGPCVTKWTWDYLKAAVGPDREVIVHASTENQMSFLSKNFSYEKIKFGDFIDEISSPHTPSPSSSPSISPVNSNTTARKLYLRTLSHNKPTTLPASLHSDFPSLSNDFLLPPTLSLLSSPTSHHSSPLRISSPDIGLWLHFDVMANILFHIRGTKRFRIWHSRDVTKLSFPPGSSSSSIPDPFAPPGSPIPRLQAERGGIHSTLPVPYEVTLQPGDAIYIPPLFPHAALPLTSCVAVNVFFRNLEGDRYAPGKDVYGNKDLAAYEKGRGFVKRIEKEFVGLPGTVRRFYMERLGEEVLNLAGKRRE